MSTDASGSGTPAASSVRRANVSLSKWVNERLPSWHDTLSTNEVARLTRRHRWILQALALLGYFPKAERFHGRRIGWRRADVKHWLSMRSPLRRTAANLTSKVTRTVSTPKQHCLPLWRCRRRTDPRTPCSRHELPRHARLPDTQKRRRAHRSRPPVNQP